MLPNRNIGKNNKHLTNCDNKPPEFSGGFFITKNIRDNVLVLLACYLINFNSIYIRLLFIIERKN